MRALLLFLTATFVFHSSAIKADMMAMQDMPVEAIIKALSRKAKTEPEGQVLSMAKFASSALAIKTIETIQGQTPEQVQIWAIKESIQKALYARPWDQKIPAQEEVYIAKNRDFLMATFGAETHAWAWMRYQIGERDQAKEQLLARYESEFKRVMKMEEQMPFGGNPMGEAEAILAALKKQVTPEQKSQMENKMRQMKAHVSQLPDSGIVT